MVSTKPSLLAEFSRNGIPIGADTNIAQRYDQNFYNQHHRGQGGGWNQGFHGVRPSGATGPGQHPAVAGPGRTPRSHWSCCPSSGSYWTWRSYSWSPGPGQHPGTTGPGYTSRSPWSWTTSRSHWSWATPRSPWTCCPSARSHWTCCTSWGPWTWCSCTPEPLVLGNIPQPLVLAAKNR